MMKAFLGMKLFGLNSWAGLGFSWCSSHVHLLNLAQKKYVAGTDHLTSADHQSDNKVLCADHVCLPYVSSSRTGSQGSHLIMSVDN